MPYRFNENTDQSDKKITLHFPSGTNVRIGIDRGNTVSQLKRYIWLEHNKTCTVFMYARDKVTILFTQYVLIKTETNILLPSRVIIFLIG